jgi:hypothetical protein
MEVGPAITTSDARHWAAPVGRKMACTKAWSCHVTYLPTCNSINSKTSYGFGERNRMQSQDSLRLPGIARQRDFASVIEKLFALGTVKCVSVGQVDRGRYEKFSIQEVDFTERAYGKWPWFMRWLCLRGMTSCEDRGEKSRDILWLCFPGLSSAEHQESFSIMPRRIDLVPNRESRSCSTALQPLPDIRQNNASA